MVLFTARYLSHEAHGTFASGVWRSAFSDSRLAFSDFAFRVQRL